MTIKNRKIYVIGASHEYANWMQGELIKTMGEADLVLFTGGEDVDPSLYKAKMHPKTYSNLQRDTIEQASFRRALALGKPCIGICRGSQFLAVMSGGTLVQHQQDPFYMHNITTFDDKTLAITSTHHQAQYPYNMPETEYKMIAWSKGISRMHEDGNQAELSLKDGMEAEIVYYPKTRCLAIQGHPEAMYDRASSENPTIKYLQELLTKFLENKI